MKQIMNSEKNINMESMPRATLILPYNLEMSNPKLLVDILESAVQKKEKELRTKYSIETVDSLIKKLRGALKKIKSIPNDKTLTVFVSPILQKSYFIEPPKKLFMPSVVVKSNI